MMVLRILVVMLVSFYAACSSSKKTVVTRANSISETDSLAGLEIIKKSDCITCHYFSEKLIGPSFSSIAGRYDNSDATIDKLSGKIIKGGKGSWGDLPMTPHSSMSKENAESVVKYILSLKK
ncbi:MAG TPA: c-type cytochrome [Chitinophagaceae bacterium]